MMDSLSVDSHTQLTETVINYLNSRYSAAVEPEYLQWL